MKRFVSILIALSITLFVVSVQAENNPDLSTLSIAELTSLYADVLGEIKARAFSDATTKPMNIADDEILFRKIPWGSTPEECVCQVKK